MDIALASMNMNQASLAQNVSTSVMKMAMDVTQQSGGELVKLIQSSTDSTATENSVRPYLGGNIDIRL